MMFDNLLYILFVSINVSSLIMSIINMIRTIKNKYYALFYFSTLGAVVSIIIIIKYTIKLINAF